MAENLRDLVVSLSLDGDNFSRNIKSINAQIKEAESGFKAAGAGVEKFEGTLGGAQAKAQMLAQKLALQGKAVEQYERALGAAQAKLETNYQQHEKLSRALEDAKSRYAELAASQGEGSDAAQEQATEIKKLEGQLRIVDRQLQSNANAVTSATTNLNNARAAVSRTRQELSTTNDEIRKQASEWTKAGEALSKFSEKAGKTGKKLTSAGKALSVGLTAPITAVGVASYSAFNEVDGGLDTIIVKTGAAGEALDSLQRSYLAVFGSMPADAEEVGVAIGEVNTRFGLMGRRLEDVSRSFIQFSKINGTDLNSSIDSVDALMTKFGVDAAEVGDVLGYLTKVGQDTGVSLTSLMSLLGQNGASLKEMGLGLSESITLMAQFEAGGVDASAALMGMKKAVQSATKDGRDAGAALISTVRAIQNAKTETEALKLSMKLFGSRGAAEMASAIRDGRMDVDALSASMSQYASVVSDTFEATLDLPDRAKVAMNKLKIAGSDLANTAMTSLEPVLSRMTDGAQGLLERFQALDDGAKTRIVRIAALVAAAGPAVAVAGKLTKAVGSVTGALGKFFKAVGSAGGGVKGLGKALSSHPALWFAVAAAVIYGTTALADYISGAKAAREALESMNQTAEKWKSSTARTFYTESRGLDAFGVSADSFARKTAKAYDWLGALTEEWSDELIETDDTVKSYVDSFKTVTDSTRDSLKELAAQAKENGYSELYAGMQLDIAELDAIDARVAALVKKRQESFLTDDDLRELSDLINRRQEIDVQYNLSPSDKGFGEIERSADAALARAKAAGADTAQVYEDALVASAQGMAEINRQLDAEYDQRYKLVQLMDDETQAAEKQARLTELDAWYQQQRRENGMQYAATMGRYLQPVWESEGIEQTTKDLSKLYTLLTDYANNKADATALSAFTDGLDEDKITEYYTLMTQVQSLLSQGLGMDELSEQLNIDPTQLETAYDMLRQIGTQLAGMDTDKVLEPLRSMFGGSLAEELITVSTSLNLDGARADWEEFAKNPGTDVFTDAIVEAYREPEGGADVSGVQPRITGVLTDVSGEGRAFVAHSCTVSAEGTLTVVTGDGEIFTAVDYTANAEGTLTGVDGEGRAFVVRNAGVTAEAKPALKDLDAAALARWRAANAGKLRVSAPVELGENWVEDLKNEYDRGLVTLYGTDGLPLEVQPGVNPANLLKGSSLVAGVDENGVYHVVVRPEWEGASAEEMQEYVDEQAQKLEELGGKKESGSWKGWYDGLVNRFAKNGYWIDAEYAKTGTTTIFGDPSRMSGLKKGAAAAGNWLFGKTSQIVSPITDLFLDFSPDEIAEYAKATETLAGALQSYSAESPIEFPEAGIQYFDLMSDAIDNFNDSGKNMDFVNAQLATLQSMGYDIKASDLPGTLRQMADQMYALNRAQQASAADTTAYARDVANDAEVVRRYADTIEALQATFTAGEVDYGEYIATLREIVSTAEDAMERNGQNDRKARLDAQIAEGKALAAEEQAYVDAYDAYVKQYLLANAQLQTAADPFDYYTDKMDEALSALKEFTEYYDELGDSGAAFDKLNADWGGGAVGALFEPDSLRQWSQMYDQLQGILFSGGTLTDAQSAFMGKFDSLRDFFGEDFLADVDLAENGGEIADSLGAGIESRLRSYDFAASGAEVGDNLDAAIRGALGAHSPATRMIPVGLDVAEGLAAGITSGTGLVTAAIVSVANAAVAAAKQALDIHSPSRVFADEVGKMAVRGFGVGVKEEERSQAKVIRNAARYLTGEARLAVAGYNRYATNNYNTDASISFPGATFTIRDKQDVYALAREIAALTRRQQTGRGAR